MASPARGRPGTDARSRRPHLWREEDLDQLPVTGNRYETVDGSLVVTPIADDEHHDIADEIRLTLLATAPPGWRPIREVGVRLPGGDLVPDVCVLRPGAARGAQWREPADVALVVEVESPQSRRLDRCVKPGLYAEAGIESFWRIERTHNGPVAHLYTRAGAGHYHLHRSVNPGESALAELPYAVQVAPASWVRR